MTKSHRAHLSEAQEDYLKQVLLLSGEGPVTTQALAQRMGVRPASVTGMLKKLASLGLVDYAPYRGVTLTEAGRAVALEVLRHHRLIETYLAEALGYDWDEVHEEAERLEHHISEAFEARIAEWLGHPERDPHGDPIPTAGLSLPHPEGARMSESRPGRYRLLRVRAQDEGTLALLARLGLVPGARFELLSRGPEGARVELPEGRFLLPPELAAALEVEEAP
ncbi:metal-dependent transcriptional regulator [Oceanithermus desulfurans]|uniref:Manganese transport regulator n=4 Tax=Oceanithermus TaxID=208447 RepID=A0A511RK14_9DEIN|nr:metal-dependent transcriptional regulator [Oceanithermus desulfurans]MBB6029353.1 DtxR family Mn-dependent transcriptional regulator [Oceanithermus desulfurans]GEM89991.1 DtxR family transcriptional regulator [Oceanithermus desulfurans NBRC 100063]